jgi:hypothetical protein
VGFDELADRLDRTGRKENTAIVQTHFLEVVNKTN